MWKGAADSKKTKRLSQDEIKKQLLESIIIKEAVESKELNRETEGAQDPEEAAKVIQKNKNIIKTNKKGIISIAHHQGKVFKKFKEKFIKLWIHKNTIIFRINVFKLCERYLKLLGSSIGLGFFKNYYKDIKTIYRVNEQEFS